MYLSCRSIVFSYFHSSVLIRSDGCVKKCASTNLRGAFILFIFLCGNIPLLLAFQNKAVQKNALIFRLEHWLFVLCHPFKIFNHLFKKHYLVYKLRKKKLNFYLWKEKSLLNESHSFFITFWLNSNENSL